MRNITVLMAILALWFVFAGCSSSNVPATQPEIPQTELSCNGNQTFYQGTFEIDLDNMSISQSDYRQSDTVYDITGFLPDKCPGGCFRFAIVGVVGTVLEIELTLENPLAIQAYDLRVEYLALFGKTVLNPDSYTDFLGTPITNIFPFTAFTKENPDREFPIGPGGIDTETLFLDFPPGAGASVNYAITAHLPGQTPEPYEISDMAQAGQLTPSGGSALISCLVLDHQDNISGVFLDATPFTGVPVEMEADVPNHYKVDISNTAGAPVGDYTQLIMALSPNGQNVSTYNYVVITVSESSGDYHWEFDDIDTFAGEYYAYSGTTEFDDISPAIIEETDGDIGLSWAGTDSNDITSYYDSIFWVRVSHDNGVTYTDEGYGDSAGQNLLRMDANKIAPGIIGDAYTVSAFYHRSLNENHLAYFVQVENPMGLRAVFYAIPDRDLETIVDADGWNYAFADQGGNITVKHSEGPHNVNPFNWQPLTAFMVAPDAYCSHVRSTDMDSSDVAWIAFYNNNESQIGLAHSTGTSPLETWDSSTVVYSAASGIAGVKNPGLFIDSDDIFHICYTRIDTSDMTYQLVYVKDDSSFSNPTEQIIYESSMKINDAHISIGYKFSKEVIVFLYENDKSIWLVTLIDGVPMGAAEEIDINTDDIDPDIILDADQCDLHSVWATMDGDNYDLARRNGVLVED